VLRGRPQFEVVSSPTPDATIKAIEHTAQPK
jgi:hypothetical protein